jgi:glycosyltransferase involved in cell wall biosynthesis
MRILFIHQNFPGQFKHLAPALAARGHDVAALVPADNQRPSPVRLYRFSRPAKKFTTAQFGLATHFAEQSYHGEIVAMAARALRDKDGYMPDVVFGHVGWGEMLFIGEVWPEARRLAYAEFFYRPDNSDTDFDPECSYTGFNQRIWIRSRQAAQLVTLNDMHGALTPTRFQASTYPDAFQPKLSVIHEGIDTDAITPDANAAVELPGGAGTLRHGDEVLTYVARNLEQYRGFHVFMRALPRILRNRPQARAVIVGGDAVSYGPAPRGGGTWKDKMLAEIGKDLDLSRVHFTGQLPYPSFLRLMQVSRAHAYLSYPFVLSWSMLEAMSAGALVVGSRTAPVEEVITDGVNGLLVDFFDLDGWVNALTLALAEPARYAGIRQAARRTIVESYDLKQLCLPRLIDFVERGSRS